MSAVTQNLRGVRQLRVHLRYLPAALVPLALAGVTVPAVTNFGAGSESLARERLRADRAAAAQARVESFGDPSQLHDIVAAIAVLEGLVPGPSSEIELFNRLRFVGDELDLGLTNTEVGHAVDLGLDIAGVSVFQREVSLAGRATLGALVDCVGMLRTQGIPVVVLEVALSRGAPDERQFQFQLRLGVLHRAPSTVQVGAAGDGTQSNAMGEGSDPMGSKDRAR